MRVILIFILLAIVRQVAYAQEGRTRNIVMISIDGYRWQELFSGADSALIFDRKFTKQDQATMVRKYWGTSKEERRRKLMPFFWNKIANEGQLYGNRDHGNLVNVRNRYRFSYPGRSEALCGYYDPEINSNNYPDNPNENVLEFVNRQEGFEGQVVTFSSWEALSRILNRDRNKMLVNVPGENLEGSALSDMQLLSNELQRYLPERFGSGSRDDVHTYALAKSYVKARHPKIIHLDFGDTDNYGHAGQYDSYLDAAHYLDAMIGALWEDMQADDFYKNNTTFLIYPDHGRGTNKNWTSHGFWATRSGETWLLALGPDTPADGEMKAKMQIYQDQFAQTMANLLGFKFEANHPVGEPIQTINSRPITAR